MADTASKKTFEKPVLDRSLLSWAGHDDPLHIARARKQGAADYQAHELPSRVGHVWKRAKAEQFVPDLVPTDVRHPFIVSRSSGQQTEARFLAGSDLFVTLNGEALDCGVEIMDLKKSPALIGQVVSSSLGFFEALNQSMWTTGVSIRVPAGVQLHSPIHLNLHTDGRFPMIRVHVVLETGASATIVEHIHSSSHHGPTVLVSEAIVQDNATLSHGLIFNIAKGDTVHCTRGSLLGNGATLQQIAASVGEGRVKADLFGTLDGERAHSEIRTFAVLQHQTELDFHTRQHHVAPKTLSDMKSKTVLLDKAVSSNTGLIRIEENARDCEAYQIARNLMLSKDAQATAIPELEIENNDVMCSHGAATGALDPSQLFYLQSRGLSEGAATRLIVEGGLQEMLRDLPESIQQQFEAAHENVWLQLEQRRS